MNYSDNKYSNLFLKQKANLLNIGNTTYKERKLKLNKLKHALEFTYKQDLRDGMYNDFKKPHLETDLTEIYLAIKEIKHAKQHLK